MPTGGLYGNSPNGNVVASPSSESAGLYGNTTNFGGTYFEYLVFIESSTVPATPTGGSWSFTTNTGTPPTGWSNTPPVAATNPVYLSIALVNSRSGGTLTWSVPGRIYKAGDAATIAVGTTTTGAAGTSASVTNSGTAYAAIFNFTIPKGDTGATGATGSPGAAATIAVGTTTTGAAGTSASVNNSGTSSSAVFNFTIPKGDTGATGATGSPGAAATIAAGTTTTGAAGTSASVTNSGTSSAAVFNFTIPRGDTGATGATGTAATIAVGTTTTGAAGTSASVTNSGTSSAAVFNFTIPRGDTGATGAGVPTGGTAGQVLSKIDGANYNTQWVTVSGTGTVTNVTGTAPVNVANGTSTPAISLTTSGANSVVVRDANQNIAVNAIDEGYTYVAASGTQITLTAASPRKYTITGSGGQVIKLPDATTLANGAAFQFDNNQSSGAITVNNNSNTLVVSVPSGGYVFVYLLSNASAAGSWDRHDQAPSNVAWSTNTFDYSGSITSATWSGVAVAVNRGGTGANTSAAALTNLGAYPSNNPSGYTNNTGTVTNVTADSGIPITITNTTTTPVISMNVASNSTSGYLSSADWNTFNGKQPAGSYLTAVTADSPLSGSGTSASHLVIAQATNTTSGYLSSTDWNTFNNKSSTNGTVTNVTGNGTVNGLTLNGTVTTTGNLTLGGTLDLSSPPAIGGTTPAAGAFTTLSATTPLPLTSGGTGKGTAPAALTNLFGYATVATAAGTTTLDNTSSFYQLFTGSTTQTVVLPVTSTLALGWSFRINNSSTGSLTIQSSGLNAVATVGAGSTFYFTCINTGVTDATGWRAGVTEISGYTGSGSMVLSNSPTITGTMSFTGSATAASSFHTAQTTGTLTLGGTSGTGLIILGRSTVTQTTSIQDGVTSTGNTKTITIGTGGASGSTTNITLGSATSGATSTVTVNGTITGTGIIKPRVSATTANTGTYAINTDSFDMVVITGQTVAITSITATGTPANGQKLWVSITSTNTSIAFATANFESSGTVTLPTAVTASTRLDVGFVWNVATSKWRCVAVA